MNQKMRAPASRISACAAGYVFVWMLFSAAATIGQRAMTEAHWLTPMMEPAMPGLAGGLLLGAGLYQFLPVKHACLTSCRSAAACVEGPRTGVIEAFRIGARHAALTLIVLFEKVAPFGMRSTSLSGGLLIGLGLWVIAH